MVRMFILYRSNNRRRPEMRTQTFLFRFSSVFFSVCVCVCYACSLRVLPFHIWAYLSKVYVVSGRSPGELVCVRVCACLCVKHDPKTPLAELRK